MFGLQIHAEIEFEMLEAALLALTTLNGLNVQGQPLKVTAFLFFLPPPSSHCDKVFIGRLPACFRSRGLFTSRC